MVILAPTQLSRRRSPRACDVHKMLLEQVEKKNTALLGDGGCNLPLIFSVFAMALRGLPYEGEEDVVELVLGMVKIQRTGN